MDGWTASASAPVPTKITGAKLFTGSYGMVLNKLMFAVIGLVVISSVWPSGAARAAICVPMLPVAPGLLSTATG